MLINGPAEWSEALVATGDKSNLLQNGYNSKLQVSAMSLGPTVVITRYADTMTGFARGILGQPNDSLVLHEDSSDSKTSRYRLVSWYNGSTEKSLLGLASTTGVEIWEVTATSGISAILKGTVEINHARGLAWNPCSEVLLVYSKTELQLVNASHSSLSWRTIHSESTTRHAWGACSWSPCGLQVSIAQNHTLHCFSWADPDSLLSGLPKHDQINVSSSGGKGLLLDTSVGPIGAVARVSPTICILATDTKLIVEGISRADLVISAMGTERRETLSAGSDNSPSLLLRPESPYRLNIREQMVAPSSDIIDLTSIRVSTSSNQSSLQILNRVDASSVRLNPSGEKPYSHLHIAEFKAGRWGFTSILDLPHLSSPNILLAQGMRVIVGSCLSPRLVVAHLDVSDRMEWTASLSGELELPPTHVCRGIYLAEKSPFADIASTEKRKRATFFHTPANTQPQPVFLSRFKVPRRTRPTSNTKPPGSAQEPSAIAADKTTKSSADGGSGGENKDLLELILAKVTAMQTQLNARFDDVDKKLQHLTARVEQIERNGGTCAKHV
ncbi:uncharacterized protein IUM83_07178 [Phytophthora cinnamomi]|uniref:uncharacterized protein n=1 Tax=Phytophthora cinnamomi TaxID=4785 RepID=UPI00355A07F0|nr:hypothetical protein IUM83_07178 [Phytophthora cinnamomi]